MKYCNTNTTPITYPVNRPAILNGNVRPSEADYLASGYHPYTPFQAPEGMLIVPDTSVLELVDGEYREVCQTETPEQRQARLDQAENERIQNLAFDYGKDVVILGALLAEFGYVMPVEPAVVMAEIKEKMAGKQLTTEQENRVPVLKDAYEECCKIMTDDEIVKVSQALAAV